MDRSKAKELVEKHIGPLSAFLGLCHWRAEVELCHLEGQTRAAVDMDVDYDRVYMRIDFDKFATEDALLDSLFHELVHLMLSPFDVYVKLSTASIEAETPLAHAESRMRTHCCEQMVRNIERVWESSMRQAYLAKVKLPEF